MENFDQLCLSHTGFEMTGIFNLYYIQHSGLVLKFLNPSDMLPRSKHLTRMQLYLDTGAAFGINSFAKMGTTSSVMNIFLLVQCQTNQTLVQGQFSIQRNGDGSRHWQKKVLSTMAPFMQKTDISLANKKLFFLWKPEIKIQTKKARQTL